MEANNETKLSQIAVFLQRLELSL